jgi:subtilase family serine protease
MAPRMSLATRPAATRSHVRRKRRAFLSYDSLENRQVLSTGAVAAVAASSAVQSFLQALPMAAGGTSAYSPQQIDSAYGINSISFSGVTGTGAGQTIAIVDAYNDPNIQSDLSAFDTANGLSAPPSFKVDNLGGTTNAGWALEESLDVEWAHAIAPKANIVLVEASSDSLSSLLSAVSTAAALPNVSVVSMSWGTNEFLGETGYESVFTTPAGHTPETFVAASGDSGAWSGPTFPSVLPNVLAVGGTSLTLTSTNTYGSETGWTDSTGGFSGLDNGFRSGVSIPSYQVSTLESVGLDYGLRTTPDVSFNANPDTGYAVYDSVSYDGESGWFQVGGTSAAAPSWAGLVAITDQGLTASGKSTLTTTQLLTDLYSLPSSDYHDITSGFNGYSAGPGYDLVTGLGTPKANLLVSGLLNASGVSTTASAQTTAATSNHATNSSIAHNAAAVPGSTISIGIAGMATSSAVGTTSGMAALPSQAVVLSNASGSSGQATSASTAIGSASGTAGLSIGLGQGSASSTARFGSRSSGAEEQSNAATDEIETGNSPESKTPDSPLHQEPAPQAPVPRRLPQGEVIPELTPADLSDSYATLRGGADPMLVRLVSEAPGARIELKQRRDEDVDATSPAVDQRSSASLVAVAAMVAFGRRVILGQTRRRRPLTAAFRSIGQ